MIFILLAFALSLYAQMRVSSAFRKYSQLPASSGLSGAQVAQRILALNAIHDVEVVSQPGSLVDHYDPSAKRLVLSEENYHGQSVAALGIAAHECGHAIQHARLYAPLQWRMAAVGITTLAGNIIPIAALGGMFLAPKLVLPVLAVAFGIVTLFQLITLPVEFDATARAKAILAETGAVGPGEEYRGMEKVLDAAALTYVAAFLSALASFLHYLLPLLVGGRSDEE
jgi:Zn-dependent membrane protease YugP